jgi:hypothetical protein
MSKNCPMRLTYNRMSIPENNTGKVSDPESLLLYVGFNTPGWLTP